MIRTRKALPVLRQAEPSVRHSDDPELFFLRVVIIDIVAQNHILRHLAAVDLPDHPAQGVRFPGGFRDQDDFMDRTGQDVESAAQIFCDLFQKSGIKKSGSPIGLVPVGR